MEESNKKEELGIYNLYKTLNDLLDKINKQSGKQLENISVVYNQKLVEIGNQLKENNITFSKATELTNTINNKMMNYIKNASSALNDYIKVLEEKDEQNQKKLQKKSKNNFFKKFFHISEKEDTISREAMKENVKENLALEKYDEMVCSLKLFKLDKDIEDAINEYIEQNSYKGKKFISDYKKNIIEQLEKIGINIK